MSALPHRPRRALRDALRSLRLGFAGTPAFAVVALDALVRSEHIVGAVLTQPDRPAGRGRMLQSSAVKQRALALGIPVHQPASCRGAAVEALLRGLDLDALVVVAYGLMLPPNVLALPRLGCFNVHASLLPRWRGAAPIQRALLEGDAKTGVTIMRMEAGLDTGPVLAMRETNITSEDTGQTLHDRLAAMGGALLVQALDDVASGTSREIPQAVAGVTYAEKFSKAEAAIDWAADAADILRKVRAFNPWPVAETRLDGVQLRIWEADLAPDDVREHPGTVLAAAASGIEVACGRGRLRIRRLQLAGRKAMQAGDFVKAMPLDGATFASP